MEKWFRKTGLSVLLAFSLLIGMAGNTDAVVRANTEEGKQSVTAKIGTKKVNKKTKFMYVFSLSGRQSTNPIMPRKTSPDTAHQFPFQITAP